MAMKSRTSTSFVMFDVVYQDGTRSSNRKNLTSALTSLDKNEPAHGIIEAKTARSQRPRDVQEAPSNPSSVRRPGLTTTTRARIVMRGAASGRVWPQSRKWPVRRF
jgi:hypothetical protein